MLEHLRGETITCTARSYVWTKRIIAKMDENVKGIMLFIEHLQGYELLTNEQLGILVRALFADIGAREMPEMDPQLGSFLNLSPHHYTVPRKN